MIAFLVGLGAFAAIVLIGCVLAILVTLIVGRDVDFSEERQPPE